MKAISIKDPWACLIIHLSKRCENRSWPIHYRGPLVICSSGKPECWRQEDFIDLLEDVRPDLLSAPLPAPRLGDFIKPGLALGLVDVVGCDRAMKTEWDEPDQWHHRYDNVRPFTLPIPLNGKDPLCKAGQGLFFIDDRLVDVALRTGYPVLGYDDGFIVSMSLVRAYFKRALLRMS